MDVRIGWAEFDVAVKPFSVIVGWAEFDARSPTDDAVPPYRPNGGIGRYHRDADHTTFDVLVDPADGEEEEIIMAILMEISAHVL